MIHIVSTLTFWNLVYILHFRAYFRLDELWFYVPVGHLWQVTMALDAVAMSDPSMPKGRGGIQMGLEECRGIAARQRWTMPIPMHISNACLAQGSTLYGMPGE